MSHTPVASRTARRAHLQPTASKLRFLLSQRPFATSPIITWSSVGGKGKGRAMSDRDMRSEARTFWIMRPSSAAIEQTHESGARCAYCVKLKLWICIFFYLPRAKNRPGHFPSLRLCAWSRVTGRLAINAADPSGWHIKKQHLRTRGAETNDRGTAQYGGMTSGAKPSTEALSQRRRPQQQRAQPGQAAEATGQAQREGPERGAVEGLTAVTTRIGCTQPGHVGWPSSKPSVQTEQHVAQPTSQLAVGRRARVRRYGGREG